MADGSVAVKEQVESTNVAKGIQRNTVINLMGSVLPTALSLITLPLYLHKIGEIRFGVLSIVWLILGYFDVFDMGVSRATSNQFARLHGASGKTRQEVFWTATTLNALFGLVGGAALYALAAPIMGHYFKMPQDMRAEVVSCLPWLGLAVPLTTISGVFVGVLEGSERFATVNTIEVLGTILFRLFPLAVAYIHGPELSWLIISAFMARVVSVIPLFICAAITVPLKGIAGPARAWIKPLFSYGGWVTINNVLFPVFVSLDRFLIGSAVDAAAVTVYSVPYNFVHRFQTLPAALARTLFPRLSGLLPREAMELAGKSVRALAIMTLPIMVAATVLMYPFLSLWISPEFARRASAVGEVLVLGVWLSSLAFIPYTLLQGQGRPRAVAFIHLAEAPFFVAAIWLGVRAGGVLGAAWVMSGRDLIDALLFLALSGLLPTVARRLAGAAAWLLLALVLVRVGGGASVTTQILGAVLTIASTIWAVRMEPALKELLIRLKVRFIGGVA